MRHYPPISKVYCDQSTGPGTGSVGPVARDPARVHASTKSTSSVSSIVLPGILSGDDMAGGDCVGASVGVVSQDLPNWDYNRKIMDGSNSTGRGRQNCRNRDGKTLGDTGSDTEGGGNYLATRRTAAPCTVHKLPADRQSYLLWIVTPVAASFSVAIVIAALAGPQWLLTEERIPNRNYNGTANINLKDDGVYLTKSTKSSLWIMCATQIGQAGTEYNCSRIEYFTAEEYSPDPGDSTPAIPYVITRAAPFFFISGSVLLVSYVFFLIATCSTHRSICYFVSGILFIVSGLLMLIGLIIYISIFKGEIGTKLRPKSSFQPPLFTYKYGQSFLLYVTGFITTEFVGVLNVYLYITLEQIGYNKQAIPCFGHNRTVEKVKDFPKMGKTKCFDNELASQFVCEKHRSMSNELFLSPRRFYFDKPTCDIHTRNITKSLNQLYTEPAPTMHTPPFERLPQIGPLTRSVSTTTDLFVSPPFNGRRTVDTAAKDNLTNMCGMTKGILSKSSATTSPNTAKTGGKTKDELFKEFCRRNGGANKRIPAVRPKDIYYIDQKADHTDDVNNVLIVNGGIPSLRSHDLNMAGRKLYASNGSLAGSRGKYNGTGYDGYDGYNYRPFAYNYSNDNLYAPDNNQSILDNFNNGGHTVWDWHSRKGDDDVRHHSRTLPRNFMKTVTAQQSVRNASANVDEDVDDFGERRISANGLLNFLKEQQTGAIQSTIPRINNIKNAKSQNYNNNSNKISKNNNNNNNHNNKSNGGLRNLQQLQMIGTTDGGARASSPRQWPRAIPTSPSSFSLRSAHNQRFHEARLFAGEDLVERGDDDDDDDNNDDHDDDDDDDDEQNRDNVNANGEGEGENEAKWDGRCGHDGETDDQQRYGMFDLDKIERERRKSHASLFQGVGYDFSQGTPV